jgi:hypothetical protein
MTDRLYFAKQSSKTEKGNWFAILQDGPASFHVSVQVNDITLYEHFLNPPSLESLNEEIKRMEDNLLQSIVEPVEVIDSSRQSVSTSVDD